MVIKKYIEVQKQMYVLCFIDYKNAFDKVKYDELITFAGP